MRVMDAMAEILRRESVSKLFCYPTTPIIEAAVAAGLRPCSAGPDVPIQPGVRFDHQVGRGDRGARRDRRRDAAGLQPSAERPPRTGHGETPREVVNLELEDFGLDYKPVRAVRSRPAPRDVEDLATRRPRGPGPGT